MTKIRIHRVFVQFRALSWAARQLSINKGTLQRFLVGDRPVSDATTLKQRAEDLARHLLETKGRAKHDIGGNHATQ